MALNHEPLTCDIPFRVAFGRQVSQSAGIFVCHEFPGVIPRETVVAFAIFIHGFITGNQDRGLHALVFFGFPGSAISPFGGASHHSTPTLIRVLLAILATFANLGENVFHLMRIGPHLSDCHKGVLLMVVPYNQETKKLSDQPFRLGMGTLSSGTTIRDTGHKCRCHCPHQHT